MVPLMPYRNLHVDNDRPIHAGLMNVTHPIVGRPVYHLVHLISGTFVISSLIS